MIACASSTRIFAAGLLMYGVTAFVLQDASVALNPTDDGASSTPQEDFEAIHDRAVTSFSEGRLEEAMRSFDRAIAINPGSALAFYNRGNLHYATKALEAALRDYTQAIKLQPDFALAYMNRGIALSTLWRLDDAVTDLDQAVKLGPLISDAYFNRAVVNLKKGDLRGALADYDRLLELDRSASDVQGARNRLRALLAKQDNDLVPDDPARITRELAHGRSTEHLMGLVDRACFANGNDSKGLARLARIEGWKAIPPAKIKANENESGQLLGAWSLAFLGATYFVLQFMARGSDEMICSVSVMPVTEHLLDDFKQSFLTRFDASHAADIERESGTEIRYTVKLAKEKASPTTVTVLHRKQVQFFTVRAVYPRP